MNRWQDSSAGTRTSTESCWKHWRASCGSLLLLTLGLETGVTVGRFLRSLFICVFHWSRHPRLINAPNSSCIARCDSIGRHSARWKIQGWRVQAAPAPCVNGRTSQVCSHSMRRKLVWFGSCAEIKILLSLSSAVPNPSPLHLTCQPQWPR